MIELVPGKHIKVIFKNMMQIEGIVVDCNNEIILKSLDGESDIIIKDPDVDIMMIHIMHKAPATKEIMVEIEKDIEDNSEPHFRVDEFSIPENIKPSYEEELKQKFEEVKKEPNSELRLETLSNLKVLLNKEEKKTLFKKLNNYDIQLVRKPVAYEHGLFKK